MKLKKSALTLALAAALSACGGAGDDSTALLASAKEYMAKREYNAAAIQLKNVLQKSPQNGEARYLLGLTFLEYGDPVAAQIELDKASALGLSSDELDLALFRAGLANREADKVLARFGSKKLSNPKAQAELAALVGTAQLARSQTRKAELAFEEALKLDSSNVTAQVGTARTAAVSRDFAEALSRVDRALATAPTHLDALLLKGALLAAQTKADEAEKTYRAAIDAAPNQVPPRLLLIIHLIRRGQVAQAAAELTGLEKAIPNDPATSYARALVLVEQKRFPEAKDAILRVLKLAPDHVPSLTLAGMASLQTGALAEAESYLRKAVFKAPGAAGAKRLLANTHLRMGQTDLALSEAKELLASTKGEDPGVHALAAEAYLASGDAGSAARHYERAKALLPSNIQLQTRLAEVRLAAGDTDRGMGELEALSAGHPQAHEADLALIATHLRQRQADRALQAIEVLEKKQPGNPLTHNLRGTALLLKADLAAARASFEHALKIQPTYLPAVTNLAQLDLREKKPARGRQRYEAVLKLDANNEQAMLRLASLLRTVGGSGEEVERLLRRAVSANPASVNARAALVNFYLRNRNVKAALASAHEAYAALPAQAGIARLLGTTQLAAAETQQAIRTFMTLRDMLPNAAEPRLLLARAHLAAKQPEEALKVLQTALALRPDLAVVQRDVIGTYLALGRPEEALRQARAAQAETPEQPHGYILEGEVHLAQKKLDLAERKYRETLKKFDLPQIAVRTHAVMEAAGKRAEAQALTEEWMRRHPKDATVVAYLGERDLASRRYESAAARYKVALERQPDNALHLNNLAWIANRLKRPEALQYAERAHELAPELPAVMDTLGVILVESGQVERGLELLARASELAPDAHVIRLNFAKALIQYGSKAAARKELEPLAKLDSRLALQQEAAKLLGGLQE